MHDTEEQVDQPALTMHEVQPLVRDPRQQGDQIVLPAQREDNRRHRHARKPSPHTERRRSVATARTIIRMLHEHEQDGCQPREERQEAHSQIRHRLHIREDTTGGPAVRYAANACLQLLSRGWRGRDIVEGGAAGVEVLRALCGSDQHRQAEHAAPDDEDVVAVEELRGP